MRPSWDEYFLEIAQAVARRGDCTRAQVGCVIVKGYRIVATGYNGTPPGDPRSCLRGDCPRGTSDRASNYSDYGDCVALHAEQNAIAHANRGDTQGAVAYLTKPPCDMCSKLMAAAGVQRIVWPGDERIRD